MYAGPLLVMLLTQAPETAQTIAQRARERGSLNLVDLQAQLKLVTTLADGRSKEQQLTSASRRVNGVTHALARFTAPAGVAGVAVLTVEGKAGEGDAVSLYLPKLKRVRQVAKSDRSKAFMDTDFSYADIVSTGASNEGLSQKPNEAVDGRPCFVLEGHGAADSPYGPVTLWVDVQTSVPMKVEYHDKAGKPFKRYRALKLKAFKDRVIAAHAVMQNLQSGSKTELWVLELETSTLGDEAFSERALERG